MWPRHWPIPQESTNGWQQRPRRFQLRGLSPSFSFPRTRAPGLERLRIRAGKYLCVGRCVTKECFVAYERGLWLLDQVHMQHANAPSHKIVVVDQHSATNTTFSRILRYTAVRGGSERRYATENW